MTLEQLHDKSLKSNMDRFIVVMVIKKDGKRFSLKSNMDRFIVC